MIVVFYAMVVAFYAMIVKVDGGLSEETVVHAAKAGANVIVAGSAIFGSKEPKQTMSAMRSELDKFLN